MRAADAVCRACHAAPKDAVNEPCGHVLHCARCAAKLAAANGGVCPECAAPATLGGMTTVKTCDICFGDIDADYLYTASDGAARGGGAVFCLLLTRLPSVRRCVLVPGTPKRAGGR